MGTRRPATQQPLTAADTAVVHEMVGEYYAQKVADAQKALEETTAQLREQVARAEAAHQAWQQNQELTSTAASGDRARDPHRVTTTHVGIQSTATRAVLQAWKAAIANPDDDQLRHAYDSAVQRSEAVERWLQQQTTTPQTTATCTDDTADGW